MKVGTDKVICKCVVVFSLIYPDLTEPELVENINSHNSSIVQLSFTGTNNWYPH